MNEVENVGSRYLFDKNDTGLTLEDNLISTLEWDISEKGHLNAFEYTGGNYIKLTKIPRGVKIYWNTKNDRAGAMLLDELNRGVKVSKQNKYGQLMNYRNYYLWSEGELSEIETDTTIILEFTGKGVEVEYLLGTTSQMELLTEQYAALLGELKQQNEHLNASLEELTNINYSIQREGAGITIPDNFTCELTISNDLTTKFNSILDSEVFTGTLGTISNHNNNHWHLQLNLTNYDPTKHTNTTGGLLDEILQSASTWTFLHKCNYAAEWSVGMAVRIFFNHNYTSVVGKGGMWWMGVPQEITTVFEPSGTNINYSLAYPIESPLSYFNAFSNQASADTSVYNFNQIMVNCIGKGMRNLRNASYNIGIGLGSAGDSFLHIDGGSQYFSSWNFDWDYIIRIYMKAMGRISIRWTLSVEKIFST